jgi:hypothetical protein
MVDSSVNLFFLEELYSELQLQYSNDVDTFEYCFIQLYFLTDLGSRRKNFNNYSFKDLLFHDEHWAFRNRFSLMISLLLYSQNSRNSNFLKPIWVLLHYRGLSNTGFHLLHELGLGPSIRSLPTYFNFLKNNNYLILFQLLFGGVIILEEICVEEFHQIIELIGQLLIE